MCKFLFQHVKFPITSSYFSLNASMHRCVKSSYTRGNGRYELIWLDRGSGANRDVGLWRNHAASKFFAQGVDANAFTAFATHDTPGDQPWLLDGRYVIHHELYAVRPCITVPYGASDSAEARDVEIDTRQGDDIGVCCNM